MDEIHFTYYRVERLQNGSRLNANEKKNENPSQNSIPLPHSASIHSQQHCPNLLKVAVCNG